MKSNRFLISARNVLTNRWVGLTVSVRLIGTAIVEIAESATEIGAHHGLLVLGVSNILKTIPDFYEAAFAIEETVVD